MKPVTAKTVAGYAGLFLLAYLLFLLAGLPAQLAIERIDIPEGLKLTNPQGSAWSGQAALSDSRGPLGDVRWQLDILPLLIGRLGANMQFDGPLGKARAHVWVNESELDISELDLTLDVLAITSRPPGLAPTRGQLTGRIDHAHADATGITLVEGQLRLQQAALTFPGELELGDFTVDFTTTGKIVTGTITSSEEPLSARGQFRLTQGSRYQLNVTLRPHPDADPALVNALRLAGRPATDGSITLVQRGELQRWIGN